MLDKSVSVRFHRRRRARRKGGAVEGREAHARLDRRAAGGKLTAAGRQAMPSSEFALPGKGAGPGGKGSGSYPIPDEGHARSALSRAAANATPAEQATIRRKVAAKFPGIHQGE